MDGSSTTTTRPPSASTTTTTTTTATATSSSLSPTSTIFRPRRSDDWQEYRSIIEQLYRNDQLKLKDVRRIMERDFSFVASEKQYKDRLAAWHVRKNIKAKEVHVMYRKQMKRAAQGKRTAFRVSGQAVDSKRIQRMVRRYGAAWDNARETPPGPTSPEPATPSDMSCYTPEPDERLATMTPETSVPEVDADTEVDADADAEPEGEVNGILAHPSHLGEGVGVGAMPDTGSNHRNRLDDDDDDDDDEARHSPPNPIPPSAPLDQPPLEQPQTDDAAVPDAEVDDDDPWAPIASFQNKLIELHQRLEESMAQWYTPQDDHY